MYRESLGVKDAPNWISGNDKIGVYLIILKCLVIEPGDLLFAASQELVEVQVGSGKEVQARKRSILDGCRSGHLLQFAISTRLQTPFPQL